MGSFYEKCVEIEKMKRNNHPIQEVVVDGISFVRGRYTQKEMEIIAEMDWKYYWKEKNLLKRICIS